MSPTSSAKSTKNHGKPMQAVALQVSPVSVLHRIAIQMDEPCYKDMHINKHILIT